MRYNWNLLYERISLRKLIIKNKENEDDVIEEIEFKIVDFIKRIEKKPYRLSINKILCVGNPKQYEKNNEWEKCKGFYCSQLVAAAYMYCGIMEIKYGAGKYKPGHFSLNKTNEYLSLKDNFELGSEFIIEFSNQVI